MEETEKVPGKKDHRRSTISDLVDPMISRQLQAADNLNDLKKNMPPLVESPANADYQQTGGGDGALSLPPVTP